MAQVVLVRPKQNHRADASGATLPRCEALSGRLTDPKTEYDGRRRRVAGSAGETMSQVPVGHSAGHDLIVIGASAGGVEALMGLVRELPPELPAALCVVLHTSERGPSLLPQILTREAPFPAHHATHGEPLLLQQIYVAPANRHLLVHPGHVRVWDGPRQNRVRPAVDPLFRSAAQAYGPRVVGVVLSGTLDDGSAGLVVIKRWGGVAIVQDPGEASFPGMPESAIATGVVDHVLPVGEIAALLTQLAHEPQPAWSLAPPLPARATSPHSTKGGTSSSMESNEAPHGADRPDLDYAVQHPTAQAPSGLVCPECGGALWERKEDGVIQYRCHVGHALSMESMLDAQADALEMALWNAVRALRERAALFRRVADSTSPPRNAPTKSRAIEEAEELDQQAALICNFLLRQLHENVS